MKIFKLLVMMLCLVAATVQAQTIDQRLIRLVEHATVHRAPGKNPASLEVANTPFAVTYNADGTLRSLSAIATLKEGAECPTERLEEMGITVRFVLGDMVALNIPANKLKELGQVGEFSYVMADEIRQVTNDLARIETSVEKVNTPSAATGAGLPKAYTGKGVVLGVIDGGIDFNHAAFRNADGTTRIKKAFIYSNDQKMLLEYNTEEEIKALTADVNFMSHGTHTSATAGGSATGNGQQGMAPETDLVLVGLGQSLSNVNIIESMKKIFDYADAVGKPAVINMSLGDIIGIHDGSSTIAKAIATLTNNGSHPGRAVIVSSGNSGCMWQSLVKKMNDAEADPAGLHVKTVLGAGVVPTEANPYAKVCYNSNYYLYADDYKDFSPILTLVDVTTGMPYELGNHVLDQDGNPVTLKLWRNEIATKAGGTAVVYYMYLRDENAFLDNANYRLSIIVQAGHDGQTVKMMSNGDGNAEPCFDAPTEYGYDFKAAGFTKGNGDMACNIDICDDAVISAGAYTTRTEWVTYQGNIYSYQPSGLTGKKQEVGEIADFSSYCIDDNGKPRPTVIAPGQGLISACNNYDNTLFIQVLPGEPNPSSIGAKTTLRPKVDMFERSNWYKLDQGTSMSAPVTTGIVALWMQAKPTLTVNEIKSIMQATCVNDDFTTNTAMIPSGNKLQAGYGKINCLAGLKKILETTSIETIGIDGRREATPSTMYSVDAPVFNMQGQQVDKSHKGPVIYKGRVYINK